MRDHCRVSGPDDDAVLTAYEAAAVEAVERWTQRLLTPRAVTLRLPNLPLGRMPIELPGGRVSAVASVTALEAEMPAFEFLGDSPALLVPAADWPVLTGAEGYPVTITYTAGYATVPADLVHAVKLIAAEMYERRENATEGALTPVVVSAEYLMKPHRIWAAA
jgi:uncharacterized phiE125 gp8 family phage protein